MSESDAIARALFRAAPDKIPLTIPIPHMTITITITISNAKLLL